MYQDSIWLMCRENIGVLMRLRSCRVHPETTVHGTDIWERKTGIKRQKCQAEETAPVYTAKKYTWTKWISRPPNRNHPLVIPHSFAKHQSATGRGANSTSKNGVPWRGGSYISNFSKRAIVMVSDSQPQCLPQTKNLLQDTSHQNLLNSYYPLCFWSLSKYTGFCSKLKSHHSTYSTEIHGFALLFNEKSLSFRVFNLFIFYAIVIFFM